MADSLLVLVPHKELHAITEMVEAFHLLQDLKCISIYALEALGEPVKFISLSWSSLPALHISLVPPGAQQCTAQASW